MPKSPPSSNHQQILTKLGYSIGNLGKGIVWASLDTFALYYMIRIAHVPAILAGSVLSLLMIMDGIADIVISYAFDRDRRELILRYAVIFAAAFCWIGFFSFFYSHANSSNTKTVMAIIICRFSYTICDIWHNTLIVRMAGTERDATMVSGLRAIFSAVGAGLVGLGIARILSASLSERPVSISMAAMLGGMIFFGTIVVALVSTRSIFVKQSQREILSVPVLLKALINSSQYRMILILVALQVCLIPLFNRTLPFVGEAHYGRASWAGNALTVITVCQVLSILLWILLTRWRSSTDVLLVAYGTMTAGLAILFLRSEEMSWVGLALIGFAQGGMNLATWALLALSIRDSDISQIGGETFAVGVFMAVLKVSTGIGGGFVTMTVTASDGWCSRCGFDYSSALSAGVIVLPVLACVACFLVLSYKLRTPDRHAALTISKAE